jgi:hypothetical protein
VKSEPESVPHAEGVKLCEPTYAQPMQLAVGGAISMISSSSMGRAAGLGFVSVFASALGRNIPITI